MEGRIYLPNIELAVSKVKSLQDQLTPYASYVPEVAKDLSTIIEVLGTPSKSNITESLEKLKAVKKTLEGLRSMAPDMVDPLIKQIDEAIEGLNI